jgi:hypothetical protein
MGLAWQQGEPGQTVVSHGIDRDSTLTRSCAATR